MKITMIVLLFFPIYLTSFTLSCAYKSKEINSELDNVDGYINIQDIYEKVEKPILLQNKEEWTNKVISAFAEFNSSIVYDKDWSISWSGTENSFVNGEEVLIHVLQSSKILFGQALQYKVTKFSLTNYSDEIYSLKPYPGEDIKHWTNSFVTNIKKINEYLKYNTDYEVEIISSNTNYFSKDDSLRIYSTPNSELLNGRIDLVITICDLSVLDVSSLIPKNNFTVEESKNIVIEFIKNKVPWAINEVDYSILYSIKGEKFKENDWIQVVSKPDSSQLLGSTNKLVVKTFNISNIKSLEKEIKNGDSKIFINQKITELIYSFESNAIEGKDYFIDIPNDYNEVQVNDKVYVSVSETSNYVIGDDIEFTIAKISLKYFEQKFNNLEVIMGRTEILDLKDQISKIISEELRDFNLENDLDIEYLNQEQNGIITGNSKIVLSVNKKSVLFTDDDYKFNIETKKISSEVFFQFVNESINKMIVDDYELGIIYPYSFGSEKNSVYDFFSNITKTDPNYSFLEEANDYIINLSSQNEYLVFGDKLEIVIPETSLFIEPGKQEFEIFSYNWEDLLKITKTDYCFYEQMSARFTYKIFNAQFKNKFVSHDPNKLKFFKNFGELIETNDTYVFSKDATINIEYKNEVYFLQSVNSEVEVSQFDSEALVFNLSNFNNVNVEELDSILTNNSFWDIFLEYLEQIKSGEHDLSETIMTQLNLFNNANSEANLKAEDVLAIDIKSDGNYEFSIKNYNFFNFLCKNNVFIINYLNIISE